MRSEGAGSVAILVAFACVGAAVRAWPFYALCVALVLVTLLAVSALCWWLAVRRYARRYAAHVAQDRAQRVRGSRQFAQRERAWSAVAPAQRDVPSVPQWRTEQMN